MRSIETVIFDLGNVLVLHDNALLFEKLAERGGVAPDQVAKKVLELTRPINTGGLDRDALRRTVGEAVGVELSAEEFFALWNCHFTVNEPMLPLVEALVGRVKLVLLSNTNAVHIDYVRPRLPLLERFDHLLYSHELRVMKPDAAFYNEALRRAKTPPERAAFFDDVPEYVEAARALGIHAHVYVSAAEFPAQLRALGL